MVPFTSKALFGFAAVTLVAAFGYGVGTSDALGTVVLAFVGVGFATLGAAALISSGDLAPSVPPGTPLADQAPVGGRPSAASPWPFAAAVAAGLFALGVATNGEVQLAAALVAVVVGVGWLVQDWGEDPHASGVLGARVRERFLLPFGLPVCVAALVAVIAISLSRIFLALPEVATRAVALAIAAVILIAAFTISASARMARTALALLAGFALVCAIGAGLAGIIHGERTFEKPKLSTTTFVPRPGEAPPTTSTVAPATTAP